MVVEVLQVEREQLPPEELGGGARVGWRVPPAQRLADQRRCGRRSRLQRGFAHTQRIYGAGVPGWFVNHVYHAPMRRSARDTLHRAAGEWNAGYRPGDDNVEDRWEPPVLYAHSAAWLWW